MDFLRRAVSGAFGAPQKATYRGIFACQATNCDIFVFHFVAQNTKTEDSGWVNVIGSSADNGNISAPPTGMIPLRYRKKGDIVYINGCFTPKNKVANTQLILFTLPAGYRPTEGYFYCVNTAGGYAVSRFLVSQTGVVALEWVRNMSDGSENTSPSWTCIDTSFPI